MKVYEKEYEDQGEVGKVLIYHEYSTRLVTGTNASSHEDYIKSVYIHKLIGTFDNKEVFAEEFRSMDTLMSNIWKAEKEIGIAIDRKVNPGLSLDFIMEEKGFKPQQ